MQLSEAAKEARREYRRRYYANLSEEAKEKQREYMREWRKRNPEKVQQYQVNFRNRKVRPLDRAMFREAVSNELMYQGLNDHTNEPD